MALDPLSRQRGADDVADEGRVVAGPLDGGRQRAGKRRSVGQRAHAPIVPQPAGPGLRPCPRPAQVSERRPGSVRRSRAGATVISAPSTSTPPGWALTGLSESEAISGRSSARTETRAMRSASAARLTGVGPAVPVEHGCGLDRGDELGDVDVGEGRDPVGDVAEELARHTGEAEPDDRADERVLVARDDARDPPGGAIFWTTKVSAETGASSPVSESHASRRAASEPRSTRTPAEAARVTDHRRRRLQDDGVADLLRGDDGLLDAADRVGRPHLDAVGPEQGGRLVGLEPAAVLVDRRGPSRRCPRRSAG